jgi:hypothetical protein
MSSDNILELKRAGASDTLLTVMIMAKSESAPRKTENRISIPEGVYPEPGGRFKPMVVRMIDGSTGEALKEIASQNPGTRTAARAFGLGGVGSYLVLNRLSASTSSPSRKPTFIVPVSINSNSQNSVVLTKWEPRKNGTREILKGGGYMSMSTGYPQEWVVKTTLEYWNDQSDSTDHTDFYKMTIDTPLPPREYVILCAPYAASGNASIAADCFDFTINEE